MALVIVIHERDLSNNNRRVIGVATDRENALRMINEYYGIVADGEVLMPDFQDIREDGIDFSCLVTVPGFLGGVFKVWGKDYEINNLW